MRTRESERETPERWRSLMGLQTSAAPKNNKQNNNKKINNQLPWERKGRKWREGETGCFYCCWKSRQFSRMRWYESYDDATTVSDNADEARKKNKYQHRHLNHQHNNSPIIDLIPLSSLMTLSGPSSSFLFVAGMCLFLSPQARTVLLDDSSLFWQEH